VRVIHQGVSYDAQSSAGGALAVSVFDSAPRVAGITGSIEILRTGTNGDFLHVSDMIEILNESNPPRTQAGTQAFEVYLPPDAKLDSVLAAGSGKMAVMISAVAVSGEPGHYAVDFPLRPGATKFAFNYDLPYDGHANFHTRHAYPLQQLAVMVPPTMKFSSGSQDFRKLPLGNARYQVEAVNRVQAGEGPEFELAGTGALPPLEERGGEGQADSQAHSQTAVPFNPVASVAAPARLLGPTDLAGLDVREKQTKPASQTVVLATITALLIGLLALMLWRSRRNPSISDASSSRDID